VIVIDTHIWLWWINQEKEKLKAKWSEKISEADHVGVSAISLFEVSWLERHKRIEVVGSIREWFDKALAGSGVELLPITPEIASMAVELEEHHTDPQDRIIMATAIVRDAYLLSADRKFRLYSELGSRLIG